MLPAIEILQVILFFAGTGTGKTVSLAFNLQGVPKYLYIQ